MDKIFLVMYCTNPTTEANPLVVGELGPGLGPSRVLKKDKSAAAVKCETIKRVKECPDLKQAQLMKCILHIFHKYI